MIAMKLFFLFCIVLSYSQNSVFFIVDDDSYKVSNKIDRDADGVVEIKLTELGIELSPYLSADKFKIPRCKPPTVNYPAEVYNSLKELAKTRIERKKLLDQKLRAMLTDEFLKKINLFEKKYNLYYKDPITKSIDASELANRLAVILAILAN
ncbi:MAG: hypothetical protein NZO16_03455 [Deltaproteobacteria bacterium]|nr:hypothetical protein [Deltaproteobacteria bacterium]